VKGEGHNLQGIIKLTLELHHNVHMKCTITVTTGLTIFKRGGNVVNIAINHVIVQLKVKA